MSSIDAAFTAPGEGVAQNLVFGTLLKLMP